MLLSRVHRWGDGIRADIHINMHRTGEVQGGKQPPQGLRTPSRDVTAQTRPRVGWRVSLFIIFYLFS